MSNASVTVRHSFEAGHRLPHVHGKCESLHGHSWQVAVTVAGNETLLRTHPEGVLVEFAQLKMFLREWIDARLDHGLMLGAADPMLPMLEGWGKVYVIGRHLHSEDYVWPTVETVAAVIANVARAALDALPGTDSLYVQRVVVQETSTNSAEWVA